MTELPDGAGWILQTADDTREHYDGNGRLLEIVLRGGLRQTLTYDEKFELVLRSVTDSASRTLHFEWNELTGVEDQLQAVLLPNGTRIRYEYDASDNLVYVRYPDATPDVPDDGPFRTYLYKYPSLLEGIVDERGSRSHTWIYDAYSRAYASIHGAPSSNVHRHTVTYNPDESVKVTGPLGGETTYTFEVIEGRYEIATRSETVSPVRVAPRSGHTTTTASWPPR
ncbi:MAG: RHS repeat protein [Thermoanaerobaculia bacterium]|nr:RHS repeat protein [Thermoanaerobaculia bacterium]